MPVKSCSKGHGYYTGRCPECQRERDKRPSSTARGYGTQHRTLRQAWQRAINTSRILCTRCTKPIRPDEPWDLDHSDDRSAYRGPSHMTCNRSAQ